MTRLQLFRLLYQNAKMNEQRNLVFEQLQFARIINGTGKIVLAAYLILMGTLLGIHAATNSYDFIFYAMPIILLVDFAIRFFFQYPTLTIKPYILLRIRKADVVDCFLLSSLFSKHNLMWLCLFLPYTLTCIFSGYGLLMPIAVFLTCVLLILTNGMWHTLVHMLVSHKTYWWFLPCAIYLAAYCFIRMAGDSHYADTFLRTCQTFGFGLFAFLSYITVAIMLFFLNRKVQLSLVTKEIAQDEESPNTHMWHHLPFLNNSGMIGEYVKLEMKSILRNKPIRRTFINNMGVLLVFTCILTYTNIYDHGYSPKIWSLYCCEIIGLANLMKIMSPEGNYIDMLMVHKENIYALLKAKYYFNCMLLILPIAVLTPAVIMGKIPMLLIISGLFTTSGIAYLILFQLAPYNKQTISLNNKVTGKGKQDKSLQAIIGTTALVLPIGMTVAATTLLGDEAGYVAIVTIGVALTLSHRLWLHNIYKRMMQHRYANIEGFHATV